MSQEAQNTAQDVTQEGKSASLALDMLKAMPANHAKVLMGNSPEVKNFLDTVEKVGDGKTAAAEEAENGGEGEEQKPTQVSVSKSKLFKNEPKKTAVFKKGDELSKFIETNYKMKPEEFFKKHDTMALEASETEKLKDENSQFVQFFSKLPTDLYNVINAYNSRGDYRAVMESMINSIDFTKEYGKQDKLDVLEYYFPGEFTKEDIEDENNVAVKKAISISEKSYNKDRETRLQEIESAAEEQKEAAKIKRTSIATSLAHLKKSFPGIDDSSVKEMSKMMAEGTYGKLFFNDDGTFTEDAALKLFMAINGETEIKLAMESASKKAATDTTKRIVARGDEKPNVKETGDEGNTKPEPKGGTKEQKFIEDILGKSNPYEARTVAKA